MLHTRATQAICLHIISKHEVMIQKKKQPQNSMLPLGGGEGLDRCNLYQDTISIKI